jgi:pyruvate/2-oxoglutarate dehydrogenase complex dihydrolipoamide acyltransferase (E2) component
VAIVELTCTEGGAVAALLEAVADELAVDDLLGTAEAEAGADACGTDEVALADGARDGAPPEELPVQPATRTRGMTAATADHFIADASPRRLAGNDQPRSE